MTDEQRIREILRRTRVALAKKGIVLDDTLTPVLEELTRAIFDTTPCTCKQMGPCVDPTGCQKHATRQVTP